MKPNAWKALALAATVLAAAAAAVAALMGGCNACLETTSGTCVPMKCHWTFIAVAVIETLAAFCLLGLVFVKCKVGRRWLASAGAIAQAFALAAMHSSLMGLCGDSTMHCHQTALPCTVLAVLVVLACIVAFAQADPKKAELPKRGL